MTHPNDVMPYASRESLFDKITRLEVENDNLHEKIRKLEKFHVQHSEQVELPSELPDDHYVTENEK